MNQVFRFLSGFSALVVLSSCNQVVESFVKGVKPPTSIDDLNPGLQTGADKALKVSPGHALTAGSNYSVRMTVTPTQKTIAGGIYAAQLSINQSRH